MNSIEPLLLAVDDPLTPVELLLAACADGSRPVSHACDQLRAAIDALDGAADDDWGLCAETMAHLLEIVDCFSGDPDSLESDAAAAIVQFVQSAIPTLREALRGTPSTSGSSPLDIAAEARSRWGEYLLLVEGDGFHAAHAMDSDVILDEETDGPQGPVLATPAEQVDLILSAMKELTGHSKDASDSPIENEIAPVAEPANNRGVATDSPFRHTGKATTPTPPAAPQAISLSDSLRDAYLEDAEQCLSSMERAVIGFESDPNGAAPINQLCRDLHTLKGASASIGLSALATYLHEIEEWLPSSASVERAVRLQPVLDCVDFVRSQIAALHAPEGPPRPPADSETPIISPPVSDVTAGAERTAEPGEETVRVKSSQLDRMMNLLVELVIWRRRRDRRVAELGESESELSRCVRRLETIAKGYPLQRLATGGSFAGGRTWGDFDGGSQESSKVLAEITNDLREIAGGLRDSRQSMADENRAVSQFIQQFRQQLAQARRVPLSGLFQRLQRVVREAARVEGKQVRLECIGQNTGLERSLQERLHEPLLHLVRNAVCHGIESDEKRRRNGKPPVGTVTIEATGNSQMLLLEVRDDGGGLDFEAIRRRGIERGLIRPDEPVAPKELSRLIFHPGFSTRSEANEVAGRGVGMDVVLTALNRCHCQIDVLSDAGVGTTFRLAIPLPSVIEHSLIFRVGGQLFGLPMAFVMSTSLEDDPHTMNSSENTRACVRLRDVLQLGRPPRTETRTLVLGSDLQARKTAARSNTPSPAPLRQESRREFSVEDILGPEEVVVRPLPPLLRRHPVLSGVTLSGAGEVVMLLDGPRLLTVADGSSVSERPADQLSQSSPRRPTTSSGRPKVLVAEDSLSARRRLVEKLLSHGFDITEASDGIEALNCTRTTTFDAIFSDLEMPGLNGFELLTAVKNDPRTVNKPVVIVTSRDEPSTQAKAHELGADGFLAKPVNDATIEALLEQLAISTPM
ncbi:MAG: response regulator [Planctomycetaceae bacterium]|nr:response regulator [Planctomycetaceae bacterium]